MAEIRVTGNGQASSTPDEATFHFQCTGLGADASAAMAQATAAAESVLRLLDDVGVEADKRGVQRAHVYPRTRWVNDSEIRDGWNANASVECTLTDATTAFDLLDEAVELTDVSVSGPSWQIRQDNPAHETARQGAVADARAKAASYAGAAGLELGTLVELIEGGANHGGPRPMMRAMAAEASALEPAEQTVGATVTLVYEAS